MRSALRRGFVSDRLDADARGERERDPSALADARIGDRDAVAADEHREQRGEHVTVRAHDDASTSVRADEFVDRREGAPAEPRGSDPGRAAVDRRSDPSIGEPSVRHDRRVRELTEQLDGLDAARQRARAHPREG
ncbi:hypothetical protein ER308_08115 [Egibacter rhizosphaerae]|uniref:Uncharacterized protein n=1 Tax=Egibacter rhizosphaerae TaxID=1670831 RepID=A0A411YE85_9ACTN|nr:hypothetical protein ER308_08115 [Egibacter rhizosphaerae]